MNKMNKQLREEKKLAMIASFMQVFCKEGLDHAFTRKLAASAGVSLALLYQYFKDKDDIIRQCAAHYHEQVQQDLTDIIVEHIENPEKMAEDLLSYMNDSLEICRFLFQLMAHPTYYIIMQEREQAVNKHIKRVAILLQDYLTLPNQNAYGASFLLNSIINDYVLKKSKEQFLLQFDTIRLMIWHD